MTASFVDVGAAPVHCQLLSLVQLLSTLPVHDATWACAALPISSSVAIALTGNGLA